MGKIDKYLNFVKEQVAVQQKLAIKYEDSPFRSGQHLESAKNLTDLVDFLTDIQKKGTGDLSYLNRGNNPAKKLHLTYEDIKDLREEQLKELNLTEADRQDLIVEHIIAQNGGYHSLDRIMVDLFKEVGGAFPIRKEIISRLYRMVSKGMIYNVPGKKGVYSTYELTEQEAKKLFGIDADSEEKEAATQPTPSENATIAPQPPKPQLPRAGGFQARPKFSSSTSTIIRR